MSSQVQPSLVGLSGMARRLVSDGVLPEADVRKAMVDSAQHKTTLAAWMLDRNLVEGIQLTRIASAEFGMPMMDVSAMNPASMPLDLISEALISKHQALPLFRRGKRLFVGIADPMQSHALDEIKFHSNCMVEPILVERSSLLRVIESLLSNMRNTMPDMGGGDLDGLELEIGDEEAESSTGIDANANDDAPVVKFINKILVDAIRRGASDIHFEPYESQYRVRLRMDGMLKAVASPPMKMANRISSRLKVMAQLDIAEKRVPQDGRIKLNLSKTRAIDFRVSSLPTLFGEKIVLRILDGSSARIGIEKLGYEPDQQKLYIDAIHKPYGMVLVTGPTGSGKTVSLYTGLNMLNTAERNISTVEDPVEIRVEGINQVQQNVKRGMTFASALRSFLRQDPDVIMVGEIRDQETAGMAVEASLTGHLVMSTLHTNSAPETVTRLLDMGLDPFNFGDSLLAVLAQRLVRRLCTHCRTTRAATREESDELLDDYMNAFGKEAPVARESVLAGWMQRSSRDGRLMLHHCPGCETCDDTGFKGRAGIHELMVVSREVRRLVQTGARAEALQHTALAEGMRTLRQDGIDKVLAGVTSIEEVRATSNV